MLQAGVGLVQYCATERDPTISVNIQLQLHMQAGTRAVCQFKF